MNEGTDPVEAAESCLAGGESMALLRIYQFKDDVEAHDDDLQEHLSKSFLEAFHTAASALDIAYGSHTNIDVDNDVESIPLCGVFRAASWNAAGPTSIWPQPMKTVKRPTFYWLAWPSNLE